MVLNGFPKSKKEDESECGKKVKYYQRPIFINWYHLVVLKGLVGIMPIYIPAHSWLKNPGQVVSWLFSLMFIWNIPSGTLENCIKSNDYVFQLQVKSKTGELCHLRFFRFNISCHRVLFFLFIDNISKSDQVLRVLPAKWLCTDEVAKICIAKSKYMCFSFSFCICHLFFLPKQVWFCSFSNLVILSSQFLLVRIFKSHLWYILTLLFLVLFY